MPTPAHVALRDVRHRHELIQGTEPAADTERARGLFFHLDLKIHLVLIHLLGQDLDRFKEIQVVESLEAPLHRYGVDDLLFVDPEFTTDHVVAGLVVAGDVDLPDSDQIPFFDVEGDRGRARLLIRDNRGTDIRERIPLRAIQLRQPGDLIADLGSLEDLARGNFHPGPEFRFLKDRVPPKPDLANRQWFPLNNRKGHGEPFLVFRELDGRQAHLNVQVAFVEINLPDSLDIVGQFLTLEKAG